MTEKLIYLAVSDNADDEERRHYRLQMIPNKGRKTFMVYKTRDGIESNPEEVNIRVKLGLRVVRNLYEKVSKCALSHSISSDMDVSNVRTYEITSIDFQFQDVQEGGTFCLCIAEEI